MCNTQLTTGQEGRWGFSCLGSFPLFVKRLTLIVSPRCECRRDMRWNTATGKLTQPAQKKNRKKQLSQTQLPSSKIRQTTTRWVRVILGRGLQQPLLQQPALWNCAQVSRSLTFSEISNLETWSPTVLESLTHYSELLKTWRGSSSCRQLCNRTLAGPSLTRLVATSLSFLSRRALSYLTRRVWPPPSSPSWTARQPARPSWPRPSAEMLTPSALSLNDKWEADDDDSRWC